MSTAGFGSGIPLIDGWTLVDRAGNLVRGFGGLMHVNTVSGSAR
jgi:hypothetical protein